MFGSGMRQQPRQRPLSHRTTLGLTGSDEGGVQGFYPIGGHDDLDVSP